MALEAEQASRTASLADIARQFVPELAGRAAEIEATRHLPQDIADRFAGAGFYRTCAPLAYGGLETHPADQLAVIETLAEADAAAAWCVMIGSTSALTLAYMPEAAARTVFSTPTTVMAGVVAPRGRAVPETQGGREGYRANGRWQWGSGSRNADWIMGGCLLPDGDGKPVLDAAGRPMSRQMVVPTSEAVLHDTWDVSGLSGTGSTDFSFEDLWVDRDFAVDIVNDTPLERPLYAFPLFGLLAMGIASVALGTARGAIADLVEIAGGKTPQGSAKTLANRPQTQGKVAECEARVRAARAFLVEAIEAGWATAETGAPMRMEERRDLRLASTLAVREATHIVDAMYTLGGGTSVYKTSTLQRRFRDIHTATQHVMIGDGSFELAGRTLLGLPTDIAQL